MTLFEDLAIAFGLVYALAAMRLVGGLPSALDPARRYWVHLTLVLSLLLGTIASFWTFWSLKDIEWEFTNFLLGLAIPGILYYIIATLVPEDPSEVASWRRHYYDVRVRFYSGLGLWGLATVANSIVNLGLPWVHPARFFQVFVLGIAVTGVLTPNPKVHGALVIILTVVSTIIAFTMAMQSGWLAEHGP